MTHKSSPASSMRSARKTRPALTPLKPLTAAILSALCSIYPLRVYALDPGALPTGGQVTAGSGSISQSGNVMNVVQGSDRMAATWNTFNIGSAAKVNFAQPSASSVALNRVTSSDASQIMGQLNANGQVYLINPSGILFGQGSAVNVGGLVASSLNLSDANFMAGNNRFEAVGTGGAGGAVINQGSIVAADGGYVALLGAQVRNEGSITARLGSVMLGAGEKITLDFNGDGLINMQVSDPSLGASVVNQGLLKANGGVVVMSARSGDALLSNVVNNEGVIEATSLQRRNGAVLLDGGGAGVVAVSGRVDVSGRGAGETGGSFKALGQYVGVFDGARIDASGDAGGGTVLVGGNYQGSGTERQAVGTYMGEDARISADALNSGDGGKVVLWSTDSTRFHGSITVLGGGQTGSGGLVETSGHNLDATGSVDISAASGKGGTWLIDPYNINITSTASVGATSSSPFTSSGAASSNLSSAVLNASLSEGANVIVQTSAVGGTSGDINVLDNVRGVGNASLTLQAHRNIIIGSGRTISNGTGKSLNVSLVSNYGDTGNGSVALTGSTISTNGGAITISGGSNPLTGYAATNQSSASGVALNGASLSTSGGNITIRGASTSTSSTSSAVNISGATLNAGGGNISIVANVGIAGATGDAFVLTGGSNVQTSGAGSITVDSTNLGSGNGTRIFSTNNTMAASGSGNLTIRGNATTGFGVLICSTASTSSQQLTVGSGNLTVQANSNGFAGAGRGVYLAASGTGGVVLNATAGGAITLGGSSTGSYGTVLNSTGSGSSISIFSDGNITVAGNTSGGTTPALGLLSSGSGASAATASRVNISSTAGALKLLANNSVVNPTTGSFKAVSLDASGAYASINLGTQSGALTLDGTSYSGRGVDIAPSGANAAINITTGSGAIAVNGNSTSSFGGYGIFLNSTGNSNGVNVTTVSGDITFRGDSIGTSDAISLGGSASSTNSVNNIASQGGNITLLGNFHSPNTAELDHGIAILNVTNRIQTTGAGNVTLVGNAADQGNGVSIYGGGKALVSVENGALAITGSSVYGDGVGVLTGNNVIRATGGGTVSVAGSSSYGSGVTLYPSTATSSAAISTVSGKLSVTGNSGAASAAPAVLLRSAGSGAANGVSITSGSGDIDIQATTAGSGEGLSIVGSSTNAFNTVSTGGDGSLRISGSGGSYGVRIDGGTNTLQVENGLLLISASAPNGQAFSQSSDVTTIAATGSGTVLRSLGGTMNNSLTSAASAGATAALQTEMAGGDWMAPLAGDTMAPPPGAGTDRLTISVLSPGSNLNASAAGKDDATP
ncbi:beta strand repeat-containing protein [Polaromonas sp. CT11-55]|uniref:beta strand repeat-containing protein n=1 Tax=Polaromonas sp. CT11-55 TaxID=3243045 RepID=UPI0039A70397